MRSAVAALLNAKKRASNHTGGTARRLGRVATRACGRLVCVRPQNAPLPPKGALYVGPAAAASACSNLRAALFASQRAARRISPPFGARSPDAEREIRHALHNDLGRAMQRAYVGRKRTRMAANACNVSGALPTITAGGTWSRGCARRASLRMAPRNVLSSHAAPCTAEPPMRPGFPQLACSARLQDGALAVARRLAMRRRGGVLPRARGRWARRASARRRADVRSEGLRSCLEQGSPAGTEAACGGGGASRPQKSPLRSSSGRVAASVPPRAWRRVRCGPTRLGEGVPAPEGKWVRRGRAADSLAALATSQRQPEPSRSAAAHIAQA